MFIILLVALLMVQSEKTLLIKMKKGGEISLNNVYYLKSVL